MQGEATAINPGVPWPATDGLGRSLPTGAAVDPLRTDRFVGIFYFLWHNQRGGKSPHWDGPYDVSKILSRDPAALQNPDSPLWGPIGMYHYWGEPLYGYYLSTDPWVLRRHAHLLADAGVDTLIFDTTNAVTYRDVYRQLCRVFMQIREEGGRTPQIAFMVNTRAGQTAQQIFEDLYQKGDYRELWFRWQGKPLMICDPEKASERVAGSSSRCAGPIGPSSRSTRRMPGTGKPPIRRCTAIRTIPTVPEQVNVSVAQNLRLSDGLADQHEQWRSARPQFPRRTTSIPIPMRSTTATISRSSGNGPSSWTRPSSWSPAGTNGSPVGWARPAGPLVFVDQFDQEYSRDIEPMRGGHADHYYWQMVANLRRYRGAPHCRTHPPR